MLEYFTKCEDLDEPAQFIARYCGPTQVVLDSGRPVIHSHWPPLFIDSLFLLQR